MIHPSTELRFISDDVGHGVVATEFIPKGTITWAFDKLDRVFSREEADTFGEDYRPVFDKYCFRNSAGDLVLCWDIGRFVNHSFRSNCLSTAYDFEIAIRDIQAGEELTDDYGYLNLIESFKPHDEGTPRKWVHPDDLLHFHEEWDLSLEEAFRTFASVDQPLKTILPEPTWNTCVEIAEGREEMASILSLYYRP